jgi:hypothetical protein
MKMKVINLVLIVVFGKLLLTQACTAAEDEAAADEHYNFSGLYVGAGLAADYLTAEIHDDDESDSNIAYSAFLGWRQQLGNGWVFGVEGALGDRRGDLSDGSARFKFDYNWHWSATAGKVFGAAKDQLLYAKLGVGGIQVKGTVHGQKLSSHNFKGTRWAVGYEKVLTGNLHAKAEASYISYDTNFEQMQAAVSVLYRFW